MEFTDVRETVEAGRELDIVVEPMSNWQNEAGTLEAVVAGACNNSNNSNGAAADF